MKLLDGNKTAEKRAEAIRAAVAELSVTPKIVIVRVGDRADSKSYVRRKVKYAETVGIEAEVSPQLHLQDDRAHHQLALVVDEKGLLDEGELRSDGKLRGLRVRVELDVVNPPVRKGEVLRLCIEIAFLRPLFLEGAQGGEVTMRVGARSG